MYSGFGGNQSVMSHADDEETLEDVTPIKAYEKVAVQFFEEPHLEIGAVTHRGAVRSRNEDQYAVIRRRRTSDVLACSLDEAGWSVDKAEAWLLVVADGLGDKSPARWQVRRRSAPC